MTSVLKIPVKFEDGKTRTISLADPKSGITQEEVTTFTQYAIDEQLFKYGGYYAFEQPEEAYIYNTNEIPLV